MTAFTNGDHKLGAGTDSEFDGEFQFDTVWQAPGDSICAYTVDVTQKAAWLSVSQPATNKIKVKVDHALADTLASSLVH